MNKEDIKGFDILYGENKIKQENFFQLKVKHEKLKNIFEDLMVAITPHSESNIIFVTGATGVGKSTMIKRLLQVLTDNFASEFESDASIIPLICVEAYANGDRNHGFRTLYESMLKELLEPEENKRIAFSQKDERLIVIPQRNNSVQALRNKLQTALRQRKTKILVIDEAFHLKRFGEEAAVMDTLKSIANTTNVKLVLVGSFNLFDFVESHGEIARRAIFINFDRYHRDNPEDRVEFRSIVRKLSLKWPCNDVPNFEAISDELMEASLGCVGLLKSIMLEFSVMQLRNSGKWKPIFLKKAAKSKALFSVIRREIEAGEEKVRDAAYGESAWSVKMLNELVVKMGAKN